MKKYFGSLLVFALCHMSLNALANDSKTVPRKPSSDSTDNDPSDPRDQVIVTPVIDKMRSSGKIAGERWFDIRYKVVCYSSTNGMSCVKL